MIRCLSQCSAHQGNRSVRSSGATWVLLGRTEASFQVIPRVFLRTSLSLGLSILNGPPPVSALLGRAQKQKIEKSARVAPPCRCHPDRRQQDSKQHCSVLSTQLPEGLGNRQSDAAGGGDHALSAMGLDAHADGSRILRGWEGEKMTRGPQANFSRHCLGVSGPSYQPTGKGSAEVSLCASRHHF